MKILIELTEEQVSWVPFLLGFAAAASLWRGEQGIALRASLINEAFRKRVVINEEEEKGVVCG